MKALQRHLSRITKRLKEALLQGASLKDFSGWLEREDIGIEGYLELCVLNQAGDVLLPWHGPNLVLDEGKGELLLLATDAVARETGGVVRSISRLAAGDGGATGAAFNIPKARSAGRTSLFYEVHRKDIDSYSSPAANKRTFLTEIVSSDLDPADFNPSMGDYYINEAGLVISLPGTYSAGAPGGVGVIGPSDKLLTHTTFPSFPFNPALGLTASFRWTLTYLY